MLSNSQIVNIFPFLRERFRRDLGRISYHRNLLFNLERGKKKKKEKKKRKTKSGGDSSVCELVVCRTNGSSIFLGFGLRCHSRKRWHSWSKENSSIPFLPVGIVLSNICLGRSNFINTYSLFSVWCTCSRTRV